MPISRINQVLNTNNELSAADTDTGVETDSDIGSKTGYVPGLEAGSEPDFDFDNADKVDLVSGVLATEADKSQINKKKSVKATSLMQSSKLTFLIKYLSISTLPNSKDFTF